MRMRMEIRPAEGGEDAENFADELRQAYLRHADRVG